MTAKQIKLRFTAVPPDYTAASFNCMTYLTWISSSMYYGSCSAVKVLFSNVKTHSINSVANSNTCRHP